MKWKLRRNGNVEATMQITYYVPRDLVDWLVAEAGMSESAAVRFVRNNIGALSDDWHTVMVDADEPTETPPDIVHFDAVREYEQRGDGGLVYEGPLPEQKQS